MNNLKTYKQIRVAYKTKCSTSIDSMNEESTQNSRHDVGNLSGNHLNHGILVVESTIGHKDMYVLKSIRNPATMSTEAASPDGPDTRVTPLLIMRVRTSLGHPKPKDATVLLDSGASSSIISFNIAKK